MEQHVRLIVLEHLSYQLDVHVLQVDILNGLVHGVNGFIQLPLP